MLWAKGRDPFQRKWLVVRAQVGGKAECIAVVPKHSELRILHSEGLPVVVYLHRAGETVLGNGNELRQMAEMGLALGATQGGPDVRSTIPG
jgi:hypothetical protein